MLIGCQQITVLIIVQVLSGTSAVISDALLLLCLQTWKTKIGGPTRAGYTLQTFYKSSSYGRTQLASYDVIGPIDMGSPACCPSACTPDNFNLQTIWDSASSKGFDLASYGHTAVGWPSMSGVDWAGLAQLHAYGDYTCWACVSGPPCNDAQAVIYIHYIRQWTYAEPQVDVACIFAWVRNTYRANCGRGNPVS